MSTTNATTRQAFPLEWPASKPRTQHRKTNGQFKTMFASARDNTLEEIRMLGGRDAIISSNVPLKKNSNVPYAMNWGETIPEPGVAVYFKRNSKEMCFACDCYRHVQDNMHAISLTIKALRGIARWGTGDMMEAAFRGFQALPETTSGTSWWTALGIAHNSSEEQVTEAFKRLAMIHHPDKGGDAEKFLQIRQAYDQAQAQFRANT